MRQRLELQCKADERIAEVWSLLAKSEGAVLNDDSLGGLVVRYQVNKTFYRGTIPLPRLKEADEGSRFLFLGSYKRHVIMSRGNMSWIIPPGNYRAFGEALDPKNYKGDLSQVSPSNFPIFRELWEFPPRI